MSPQSIQLDGKSYVILPRDEYERLREEADLPALPEADEEGLYPAVAYARAALARKIVRQRRALGLTQRALAKMAKLPAETLCRIERGLQTPTTPSIMKIEQALERAGKRPRKSA
jgi:ribosome-binding protein aMBF1 (putative translation factor)